MEQAEIIKLMVLKGQKALSALGGRCPWMWGINHDLEDGVDLLLDQMELRKPYFRGVWMESLMERYPDLFPSPAAIIELFQCGSKRRQSITPQRIHECLEIARLPVEVLDAVQDPKAITFRFAQELKAALKDHRSEINQRCNLINESRAGGHRISPQQACQLILMFKSSF